MPPARYFFARWGRAGGGSDKRQQYKCPGERSIAAMETMIPTLVQYYSISEEDARVPSVLIAGPANFPVWKKE